MGVCHGSNSVANQLLIIMLKIYMSALCTQCMVLCNLNYFCANCLRYVMLLMIFNAVEFILLTVCWFVEKVPQLLRYWHLHGT